MQCKSVYFDILSKCFDSIQQQPFTEDFTSPMYATYLAMINGAGSFCCFLLFARKKKLIHKELIWKECWLSVCVRFEIEDLTTASYSSTHFRTPFSGTPRIGIADCIRTNMV